MVDADDVASEASRLVADRTVSKDRGVYWADHRTRAALKASPLGYSPAATSAADNRHEEMQCAEA